MQTEELSYAIITPYTMRKSRTGGIIARLISRTGLDLVAARMFAPSEELVRRYAETIVSETEPSHRATQELIRAYVLKNFTGEKQGQRARVLCLIFRGAPDERGTSRGLLRPGVTGVAGKIRTQQGTRRMGGHRRIHGGRAPERHAFGKARHARHGKMHCPCLSGGGRSSQNSRSTGPHRSREGAARLDSKRIWPNYYD